MHYRFLLLLLALPLLSTAQPLFLDPGFGQNGAAISKTAGWGKEAYAMVRQPDGKLLVAGVEYERNGMLVQQSIITRFLPDGQPDNSFGANGSVRIVTGNKNGAQAISLQADGKIVVAANETITRQQGNSVEILSRPFMARFNTNGSPDNSFGTGGIHRLEMLDAQFINKELAAITVLPDGKILAGGTCVTTAEIKMMLIRLNADGSYDNGFATSGLGQYIIQSGRDAGLRDMAVQSDGKIIIAGTSGSVSLPAIDDRSFALARINTDGTPDIAFGTQGVVVTRVSGTAGLDIIDIADKVALLPDGRICLAGSAGNMLGMARYLANGAPDLTFGQGGKLVQATHPPATGLVLHDGRLYTCGMLAVPDYMLDISLSAFNADGSADHTFAPNGMRTAHIYSHNYTHALLAQPDGKIVTAGAFSNGDNDGGLMLTRFARERPTGIAPAKELQATMALYPNPAGELLTLAFKDAATLPQGNINIISSSGQLVYSGKFKGHRTELRVSHLAAGMYALRISTGNEVQTLKFTKAPL